MQREPAAIFAVDLDGAEIPGSRRVIGNRSMSQFRALHAQLAAQCGEDAVIRDNIEDWAEFWRGR